jgi:2-dehydropantoate 2-reductase
VIPLLNGVDHLGRLREVYGPGRVAAGAIRVESERVAPGHIVQSSPFVALELASASDELRQRLEAVAEELGQAGLACRVSDDEMGVLWAKLAVLCPFALVSAASGLDLGGIREDPAWRDRLSGCAEELRAVAAALGVEVDSAGGALLERGPATMRTSMQKDVAAGRPPELEAIAGPVIRGGEATGVDVPTTRELADAVRRRAAT